MPTLKHLPLIALLAIAIGPSKTSAQYFEWGAPATVCFPTGPCANFTYSNFIQELWPEEPYVNLGAGFAGHFTGPHLPTQDEANEFFFGISYMTTNWGPYGSWGSCCGNNYDDEHPDGYPLFSSTGHEVRRGSTEMGEVIGWTIADMSLGDFRCHGPVWEGVATGEACVVVPEPGSTALMLIGMVGLVGVVLRRRKYA